MADDARERRFLDDVPLEILEPVAPEVYASDPNPYAGHRPAPPLAPSPMAPAPYRSGPYGHPAWSGAPMPYPAVGPHAAPHLAAPRPAPYSAAAGTNGVFAVAAPPAPRPVNTMAVLSLALSLCGFSLVGAVLGFLALREIERTGEEGRGMALAGLWVGVALTTLAGMIVLASAGIMLVSVILGVLFAGPFYY